MTVNGVFGAGSYMQAKAYGRDSQMDSVGKNIQKQIENAQKRLQELSSNEELTIEEKMKKRQEIQQEIANLNQQLRQHEIEQRKEQQNREASTMDDMVAGTGKTSEKKGSGLSQAGMKAMLSADASMKQAHVQGSVVSGMEGKARVLETEIKEDKSRGVDTEKKEEELEDLQANMDNTTAAQISSLTEAVKAMDEAAETDREKTPEESGAGKDAQTKEGEKTDDGEVRAGGVAAQPEREAAETAAKADEKSVSYTPIDVRL